MPVNTDHRRRRRSRWGTRSGRCRHTTRVFVVVVVVARPVPARQLLQLLQELLLLLPLSLLLVVADTCCSLLRFHICELLSDGGAGGGEVTGEVLEPRGVGGGDGDVAEGAVMSFTTRMT